MDKHLDIYFVRHGETLFNRLGRIQGFCDSPLTDKGKNQAKMLARGLKDISFNHVITSSSERAVDTAKIITNNREDIIISKLFKEMNFGLLEGSDENISSIEGKIQELMIGYKHADGESCKELKERISKGLEYIQAISNDKDKVLVTTHGVYIMTLLDLLVPGYMKSCITIENPPIQNCSLTHIVVDEQIRVETIGDVSYLEKGKL